MEVDSEIKILKVNCSSEDTISASPDSNIVFRNGALGLL